MLAIIAIVVTLSQKNSATDAPEKKTEQPQFSTILPSGKPINQLGGWSRVSPPNTDPVFAYNDKIGTTPVNVSQQPLPDSFNSDVDGKIADLAKKYSAEVQITAGSTKVYIGTSSKGPQSVIFSKNNLLILIKSQEKIDDKDWSKYIESLN